MYVLGHVGLTLAAAKRVERGIDARWAALLALGPDLLDKPLALTPLLSGHATRSLGHSLAFSLWVLGALLLWKRKARPALVLWCCYAVHFALDAMWTGRNPVVLLWPLLGGFPPPKYAPLFSWLTLWNVAGEMAGAAALWKLGLFDAGKRRDVLRTGRL